jgi:hypothetical protein
MATTAKLLVDGTLLTAALVTLYTTPANTTSKIYEIVLCNTGTVATVGVTMHLVSNGDTAADKNKIMSEDGPGATILIPGETRLVGSEQRIPAGYFIQAKADTTDLISIRISGDEVV